MMNSETNPEDFDLAEVTDEGDGFCLKEIRDFYGDRDARRQYFNKQRKGFIKELFEAYRADEITLTHKLAENLVTIFFFDYLEQPLPQGRPKTYSFEDKLAFVDRVDELRREGKTIKVACKEAGEELFPDNKSKRPGDSPYSTWKRSI